MGIEQLQGTPWHPEQIHKTCKEGSKYCIYNRNKICVCTASDYHNKQCVGKGECMMFEPKTGIPKVISEKTIIVKQNPKNSKEKSGESSLRTIKIKKYAEQEETESMSDELDVKGANTEESKEEKFKRLSKDRVNKVVKAIETLEHLSNKNQYEYSEKQVEKMFNYIEDSLAQAKASFANKKSGQKFDWE